VLEAEPSNVDVLQRLALVEYEQGRYESAVALLERVIELRPELPVPRENLRMLQSQPGMEDGICREVLPRLAARAELLSEPANFAPTATRVHLVLVDDDAGGQGELVGRIRSAFAPRPLELWAEAGSAPALSDARALTADAHPAGGLIVLLGASRSVAAWLGAARAERVLVVAIRDEPCALIDRIDEVALLCDARPGLACASRELTERLRLPAETAFADAVTVDSP
jgi:hypothetical protein